MPLTHGAVVYIQYNSWTADCTIHQRVMQEVVVLCV